MDYGVLADEFFASTMKIKSIQHRAMPNVLHGDMMLLHFIIDHGREITPGKISAELGFSTARIASSLRRLEEKGLIERRIDEADRRKVLVSLTESGVAEVQTCRTMMRENISNVLKRLGEEEAKDFIRLTREFIKLSEETMDD